MIFRQQSLSVASNNGISSYLSQLGRLPDLSSLEEFDLARRYQEQGDQKAGERLIYSHLRLVIKIALKFKKTRCTLADLIQEGNVGLVKALDKFDPHRGIMFSHYASFWIRANIMKYIMDNWCVVKLGTTRAQRKLFHNLGKEKKRLESMGLTFDERSVSQRMEVPRSQVLEMIQRMEQQDLSLDTPYNDDSGVPLMDTIPDRRKGAEEIFLQGETVRLLRHSIRELMPELCERQKDIVRLRLLTEDPASLRELGEKHGLSKERVRQLESRLLDRIKNRLQCKIDDFSGECVNCA